MIALLGRRDRPTDALDDYCRCLSEAFAARGHALELERVGWPESGWLRSLFGLASKSRARKGQWVLVQYTALAWSRRGFPLLFLMVLGLLRLCKTRIAVVFHDTQPYTGRRLVDTLRRACQLFVMRSTYRLTDASILCIPLENVSWLPPKPTKARFIPVGANIPAVTATRRSARNGHEAKTIAVFGITGGGDVGNEVLDIAFAAKTTAKRVPRVRLVTLGRGSIESETKFREALHGSPVEYNALGILSAQEVSRVLAASDVALFVRGRLSTQRGSAIASIACGVPLVAYADACLPAPLAEAGVLPVRCGDGPELADATVRVLTDHRLWLELHQRSQRAHVKYFSWQAVTSSFLQVLGDA